MAHDIEQIAVIGDGGWGTTLAIHLAKNDYPVKLWGPFPTYLRQIRKNRYNPKFLPGIRIPKNVFIVEELKSAVQGLDLLVFAVPSQYAADVLKQIKATRPDFSETIICNVTKGLELDKGLRMSQLIEQILGPVTYSVLSGPTIAVEVAKGIPSSAVVAAASPGIAKTVQKAFNSDTFRIYTNKDVIGVELGGSIKNIIAIACGVCDGLGFGTNTKSAIVARGLAEMSRFGKAMGAKTQTFAGLSGIGDLVTTCFSPRSRNRTVGEQLGSGKSIKQILTGMAQVAEGVETVKAIHKIVKEQDIPMPICTEVYNIIYNAKDPSAAVHDLMTRDAKPE